MKNSIIYRRRSVRTFTNKEVSDKLIREIVTDAKRAPSWQNAQPWHVYVAKENKLDQIKEISKQNERDGKKGKPELTVPNSSDRSELSKANIEQWEKSVHSAFITSDGADRALKDANHNFFFAPAVAWVTVEANASEFTIFDAGAFSENLMLAAKEHGVDSMPAYQLIKYPDDIRKVLEIPQDQKIIIGIALGYADDSDLNRILTKRAPTDEILTIQK